MSFKNEILSIPGAPLLGECPLPKFRERRPTFIDPVGEFPDALREGAGYHQRFLPYTIQDRYDRRREMLKLRCLVLENEYLRAEFLPEYGGRLHRLYDKVKKCDLLFTNTVIQPCNLALRNAWLSGGIEWNIGVLGHTFTTCDNVFAAKLTDSEGNDFIRIYEFERLKSLFWQVDFHLPKGSKLLITHVKMINPFDTDTTTYWWTNIAVPETGKTRIVNSGKHVIVFMDGTMSYDTLPNLKVMPGDSSYSLNATRSFDFFVQENRKDECTWETACYDNGVTFFERSTPPLSRKKLYVWGAHRAGYHWQEFLSEDGKGYYAEIQAGIAPSQLHDFKMKKRSTYEWTQVFGGLSTDNERVYDENYDGVIDYIGAKVDSVISEEDILALDKKLSVYADMPVSEDMLLHTASGFGALEIMRMEKDGDGKAPESMCFPTFTVGAREYPWYSLLKDGILPAEDTRYLTPTFMTSEKWLPHIKASLEREGGKSWYSLMHYGNAVYDGTDLTGFATEVYSEEAEKARVKEAESLWLESLSIAPSYYVCRNLAVLEKQRGRLDEAVAYYEKAMKMPGAHDDFALANEYLETLHAAGKYERAWEVFESLPVSARAVDRVRISAAINAVKINKFDFLDIFFTEAHHSIREGDDTLTDIWFEFCARKMAFERGITITPESLDPLIDEAWEKCTPDILHDFRQSYNRKDRYRV